MPTRSARPSLDQALATPANKRRYVRDLFGMIARRYDLITRVLSYGADRRWKERLIHEACVAPGARILDLACGTGDLAFLAAARGARVAALDLAEPMIDMARRKPRARDIAWMLGDMCALPVAENAVDCVTTGYGLRNVPDLTVAVAEIYRVLRPGGRVCSLDFDRPRSAIVRFIYLSYLTAIGSLLGWILHGDADAYRYIPASIRRYPGAEAVAELMRRSGFTHVRHVPVLGGLMALHIASKGPSPDVSYNEHVRN